MTTATRTTTSRKAMRVATVFTGAAAAAVGFAPGALAAPGHAAAQGHAVLANGTAQALAPASGTQSGACTTNTWLHIQYYSPFRQECRQFGFVGTAYPLTQGGGNPLQMTGQCGGNNAGHIYPISKAPIAYRQGSTYRGFKSMVSISYVSISRYNGTETCHWPK